MPVPMHSAYGPVDTLADWLRANDVDPSDVPINGPISIEPLAMRGGRCIRYTALLRNETGHLYCDPATGRPAEAERTVPLKVEPERLVIDGA